MTAEKDNLIAALEPLVSRARTDVTAIKAPTGMAWTREALTEARLKRHLDGTMPRGVCPIKAGESTTKIALFDLDSHKGEVSWVRMASIAACLTGTAQGYGVELTPFRSSGGNGIHLFAVWDEPQDAYSVRQLMTEVLTAQSFKNGAKGVAAGEIEVFPKQDSVPEHGFGNQFILPLAGKSAPLEPICDYEPMPREYALQLLPWPVSAPVPVVERPQREISTVSYSPSQLSQALDAIPNDTDPLGYDEWRDIISAIHHATGGSDDGYQLAYGFSARAPHFNEEELALKVWAWLDNKGEAANPITERTIFAKAREHGWEDVATADDFEDLTPVVQGEQIALPLPGFQRDGNGRIEAVLGNVRSALLRPDVCGMDIRYDTFRAEIVYADVGSPGRWLAFKDHHAVELRWSLEQMGFKPVGRELMRDVVNWIAQMQSVDSAQVWLKGLRWDGVPRVASFYERYFNVEASPYTTAVSRYIWTAMAGRVMVPGIQADMVPILTGAQGQRKTGGVKAMVPLDTFRELSFHQSEEERARLMRGALMIELGELSGLRTKENEQIKAWITRCKEDWTPKYQEYAVTLQRRCVMIGTSNPTELLDDPTGARRWLPMASGEVDVAAIARDRDQLWAEGLVLFDACGVAWQEAQALAEGVHENYRVTDSWEDTIARWMKTPGLDSELPGADGYSTHQILTEALCFREHAIKRADEMRAAKAMKALGFRQKVQKVEGKSARRWVVTS